MALDPPTEEILASIRAVNEVDEETIKESVRKIRKWLDSQPHLPKCHGERRLGLLYLQCKKRLDKVYSSLNAYYSMRNKIPELLCNRDPSAPWFTQTSNIICFVPLPQLTDDLCRVTITAVLDPDVSKYHVPDTIKLDTMVLDLRLLEEFTPFDIIILDFAKTGPKHLAKYTLPILWKVRNIALDGFRLRIKSMHFVNAPIYIDFIIGLCKLVLKPKIFNRIHVHRGGLGTLHKYVTPRILPLEYGGEAGSIYDMWDVWKNKITNNREWFIQQEQMKTDETKRPPK